MNDENSNLVEENNTEWKAPPPPETPEIVEEPAQMSEIATIGNIFLEPGRTFEDLRRKPRFLLAGLIVIICAVSFQFLFINKMGEDKIKRAVVEQINKSPQADSMSPEQKQQAISMNMKIQGVIKYLVPVFIVIFFAIGGLIYWLGTKAMGGSATYLGGLSVWIYSSLPAALIGAVANILVLFLKSADDIDVSEGQRGLVHANPSLFFDGKSMPVLTTLISTFDVFVIWGLILAAIGLHKVGKISKGSAWTIAIIVALIGVGFRLFGAYTSGNPS